MFAFSSSFGWKITIFIWYFPCFLKQACITISLELLSLRTAFAISYRSEGFPGSSVVKIHLPMQEMWVRSLGQEDPRKFSGKKYSCQTGDVGLIPGLRRSPWRRKWQPTPLLLPGKSHGQRKLAHYHPWGCKSWTQLND